MNFPFTNHKGEVQEIYIANKTYKILVNIVDRINKYNNDALLIVCGDTGTGKSNITSEVCACVSYLTGRKYNVDNVYFKSDEMMKKASETENQIFHYDEALFASLAQDWQKKAVKDLIATLLLSRKKKHFYIFCIPDFFKLKDTIAVDKSAGLIRTYLIDKVRPGKYVYYKKKKLDDMYEYWQKKKIKGYKTFYSFHGDFKGRLADIIDEAAYEAKKDEAIKSVWANDPKKLSREAVENEKLKAGIAHLQEEYNISNRKISRVTGIDDHTVADWRKFTPNTGVLPKENGLLGSRAEGNLVIDRDTDQEKKSAPPDPKTSKDL